MGAVYWGFVTIVALFVALLLWCFGAPGVVLVALPIFAWLLAAKYFPHHLRRSDEANDPHRRGY